jgi:predicted outer membrane repeat protein
MKATLLACSLLASVITAHSATLVVRTTSDASTDSLRQKILEANPAGGDTIVFAIPTSSPGYDSTTGVFTIGLTSGELVIDKNVRIDGSAQKISIRRTGGSQFRIFRITAGTVATLNDLAISNGYGSAAAGVWNFGGDLTLRNCTLYDNIVPLDAAQGGAISTSGTLRVSNCTFTANSAIEGTAIYGTGSITIDNTTIFGNGSGNSAVNPVGAATVRVRNTIIAGNSSVAVGGTFISEGYNLIGGQAAGTTGFGAIGRPTRRHDDAGKPRSAAGQRRQHSDAPAVCPGAWPLIRGTAG